MNEITTIKVSKKTSKKIAKIQKIMGKDAIHLVTKNEVIDMLATKELINKGL